MLARATLTRAGLQRLAQRIEHRALEFGQLVEEQHAKMRQADFARPDLEPAADQRRHRAPNGAGSETAGGGARRPPSNSPATLATIDTSSASDGSSGGKIPGRQAANSDFPAPGGPLISQVKNLKDR